MVRNVFRQLVFVSFAALSVSGCIVEAPTASSNSQGQGNPQAPNMQRAVTAPPLQVRVGANLDNKINLAGVIVDPGVVTPGAPVRMTAFYQVLDTIPEDWMVFVHVEDVDGHMERLNVDHKPAGGNYPTNQWKKGETVKDEFQIYLPPGSQARGLNVFLGFWNPANDQRMHLKNPDQVKSDGKDRILVAQIPVAAP